MNIAPAVETDIAPFEVNLGDERTEFSGTTRLFAEVAQSFGVELQEQERKDWQTLGRAAYIIDQYLDVERGNVEPNIAPLLFSGEPIAGVPAELSEDCRQFVERQTEVRQSEIREQLELVRLLVEKQAAAVSAIEVVYIRQEEAELLTNLCSLSTNDRRDASGRQRFNAWLRTFYRTGYLLDSFLDVKEDFESGASGVRPSLNSRLVIGAAAVKEALFATRKMSPRILGKCAIVALRYEIQNKKPDFTNPGEVI